jgi:hypothetical protein
MQTMLSGLPTYISCIRTLGGLVWLVLMRCDVCAAKLPIMEIVFLVEKTNVVANELIEFSSAWGMPVQGEKGKGVRKGVGKEVGKGVRKRVRQGVGKAVRKGVRERVRKGVRKGV